MAKIEQFQSRTRTATIGETRYVFKYLCDTWLDLPAIGSMLIIDGKVCHVVESTLERYSPNTSMAIVTYSSKYPYDPSDPLQYEYEFDMSAVTREVGRAGGEDIPSSLPKMTERYEPLMIMRISRNEAVVNRAAIMVLAGKTNNDVWGGGPARTWLFLGATSRRTADASYYRTTYTFSFRPGWANGWMWVNESGTDNPADDKRYNIYETGNFEALGLVLPP